METKPECLACLLTQGSRVAALIAPEDQQLRMRIVRIWAERIAGFSLSQLQSSPPLLAAELYAITRECCGVDDPFHAYKCDVNAKILERLPALRGVVAAAQDRLKAALSLALTANFIDAGAAVQHDWEAALLRTTEDVGTGYASFLAALERTRRLLILGDNAGEIGLDVLLVQELRARGCDVVYAVRGGPVLNDATHDDAELFGLTALCRVIDTGDRTPGVDLDRSSPEFLRELARAGLVLSKGQGNFESLEVHRPDIFFGFKAKCEAVSRALGVPLGATVFRQGGA